MATLETTSCRRCKRQMLSVRLVQSPDGLVCGPDDERACRATMAARTPAWDKYLKDGAAQARRMSQSKAEAKNLRASSVCEN